MIASEYNGCFTSLVFWLPREMTAATPAFWGQHSTSQEGTVAVEVSAGWHVGDWGRSVLQVMERNLVNAGASQ